MIFQNRKCRYSGRAQSKMIRARTTPTIRKTARANASRTWSSMGLMITEE